MENFHFKKKYGQNFLRNPQILGKIAQLPTYLEKSLVIEVGPGAAALTKELAKVADQVLCYEVDLELEDVLTVELKDCPHVKVIFEDFLKRDLKQDLEAFSYDHLYFVSNVPYYITTPILFKLLESELPFEEIVMLVQKEVGERFTAPPKTKQYGALTVLLHYFYEVRKCFEVHRTQFVPAPHVDSVVVSFKRKETLPPVDRKQFSKLVHDSFRFKRKTLYNNLREYPKEKLEPVLEQYGFTFSSRAEEIPVDVFVALANSLTQK